MFAGVFVFLSFGADTGAHQVGGQTPDLDALLRDIPPASASSARMRPQDVTAAKTAATSTGRDYSIGGVRQFP